jgi:UDP-glucose:(heptosyl)LPS alpha-1,3-glucosyltransferase
MRIALVIERMDPAGGGRETSTAQMATELAARGHEVTVLCQRGAWQTDGVNVIPLGRRGWSRRGRLAAFVADVQQATADGAFDIVHTTLPIPGATIYQPRGGSIPAQRAASRRRRSHLTSLLTGWAEPMNRCRALMADLERQVVADPTTRILAVSRMVADEYRAHYGRTEGVSVIYNAVETPPIDSDQRAHWRQDVRYRLGLTQEDTVFITLAKNFELKGVGPLIETFAQWVAKSADRQRTRLLVVGREHAEGYERISRLRQVGRQVVFIPPTPEVYRLYSAADACVLLSWYDPCSRVVLEATGWGVPSLTTAFNGASEILADGAGIVVPSPVARGPIMDGLTELADRDGRAHRRQACLAVGKALTISRHIDELELAYQQALEQ